MLSWVQSWPAAVCVHSALSLRIGGEISQLLHLAILDIACAEWNRQ